MHGFHLIILWLFALQIIHTLSVSLNKIGDLKYYGGDLQAARSYYVRSLNVRRDAVKHHSNVPSQVIHLLWQNNFYFVLCFFLLQHSAFLMFPHTIILLLNFSLLICSISRAFVLCFISQWGTYFEDQCTCLFFASSFFFLFIDSHTFIF